MQSEHAANFDQRLVKQREFEELMLSGQDEYNWGYPFGDYRQDSIVYPDRPVVVFKDSRGTTQYLNGYDIFLHTMIPRFLEAKGGNTPTMVLDIGGGVGDSWSRLALCFEDEVRDSQLAFVVSNLLFTPEQHFKKNGISKRSANFISQGRDLVHYINGRYSELRGQSITLPNGQELTLEGQADLVNERRAITAWSKVPEVDILEVPPLLSPYGIYLVNGLDISELQAGSSFREEGDRLDGIHIAHELLQKRYGLERIRYVEEGEMRGEELGYAIFKREQAPLIEVN